MLTALAFEPAGLADELDDFLRARMEQMHLPGLAVAVLRHGEVETVRCLGLANVEQQVPVGTESVFEIGSVTKQFTAAAIMLLVEDGRLALDDRLDAHVPGVPAGWPVITVRHLLTHTAGIANYLDVPGLFDATAEPDVTHDDIATLFFTRLPIEFPPGESWAYSNTGYLLLGNVVEHASGETYWEFLARRVLQPLGLERTRSSDPAAAIAHRVQGYGWTDGRFERRPALTANAYAAGAIASTIGDMARWEAALHHRRLLAPASYEAMWTACTVAEGALSPCNYGFGWQVDTYRGGSVVYHSGGTPGFSSVIHRYRESGLTVIMLTNSSDQVIDHLALDVAGRFEPSLARPAGPVTDPDPEITRHHERILAGLLAGVPEPAACTAPMQRHLQTMSGRATWQWLGAAGALRDFAFRESEDVGGNLVRRYRVQLGEAQRWFSFTTTAAGNIAQVNWW